MATKDTQKREQPDYLKSAAYFVSAMGIKAAKIVDEERLVIGEGCFWKRTLPAAQ